VAPLDLAALAPDGRHDGLLDALLRRPALLVGGKPQISIGYNDNFVGHEPIVA